MPDIPVKLYVEKILKQSRSLVREVALLSGPTKNAALRAMADELRADEQVILAANAEDVEALARFQEREIGKDRMKELVGRVRMPADAIKEMADRLCALAELPDPVGTVTGKWERPDGLQVGRVRVPIGVIAVISEMNPLVTVETIALCLKSGNLCVFRGAPEWKATHQALETALRRAAERNHLPAGSWVLIARPEKEIALELMRASKDVDALLVRGGSGLRKVVAEQARVPVLGHDGGLTHLYVDGDVDIPMAQNVVINSKVQQPTAANSLDTLLVEQIVGRQLLPPLINRLLEQFKIEVRGCPKTIALMGQMAMTGHTAIVPATDADWQTQFQGPILAVKMVQGLDEAIAHIADHGPCLTAVIATDRYESAMRFTREVDAAAVLVNASSRLHGGDSFGLGADAGFSVGRLHAKGPIGLEQLTCEKYVAWGTGQLKLPHPVPDTYFDAIMLKRA
ncbi:MAG: glutamate-5-semialdehyde dehydrogenase [Nitrospira sp.]|nr:glutamate-5-semialdehyde dehydrogenase [Nitrospira sp.]MCP9465012.1 glutamate-5-semialdehyde dehydrogenase [Nitrospira sp.]